MAQENVVQLGTRVHPDVFRAFDLLAHKKGRSKAYLLREMVEEEVRKFEQEVVAAG